MAYTKTDWKNNIPPSIDEVNLKNMESGIYNNSLLIDDINIKVNKNIEDIVKVVADIQALGNRVTTAESNIATLGNRITNVESTKANKTDVPTISDFTTELGKKVNTTTYNTFVNTTLPNTYYKKSETYTRAQIDSKDNGKLSKNGDTANGNYTINGSVNVNGTFSTWAESITFDSDNNMGLQNGGYRLFVQPGNPGGGRGDVWIKNA